MQKLIRRSALSRRQAERRVKAVGEKIATDEHRRRQREQAHYYTALSKDVRAERVARREDWVMGPIAPKRDVGKDAGQYGTLNAQRLKESEKREWKNYGIVPGDRVVIVKKGHRDQGKIGVVKEVTEKAETCKIERLNVVSIEAEDSS